LAAANIDLDHRETSKEAKMRYASRPADDHARLDLAAGGVVLLVLVLGLAACSGDVGTTTDGGSSTCTQSGESGLTLLPFGPIAQEINTSQQTTITVFLGQRSEQEGQGSAVSGAKVAFKIITQGGDAKLSASEGTTDSDGLATITFTAGTTELSYQVEASREDTCAITFTIDAKKPLRQLRALLTSPYNTYTSSRVALPVEATTDGYGKLSGEQITFSIGLGKTSETTLLAYDGSGSAAATLKTKTDSAGRASVLVYTGSKALSELKITASMSGTADAEFELDIAVGSSKSCTSDSDCPLGYQCKSKSGTSACETQTSTPSTGCKSDSDCASPTVCQTSSGKCLTPSGKLCDAIEGKGCASGEVCIGKLCATLPSSCTTNLDCPTSYVCTSGVCVPGGMSTGGCTSSTSCGSGYTCINGSCVSKSSCSITHNADRLKGTWSFDSKLNFEDALSPLLKGLLGTASTLRDIIQGKFSISGIPSWISSLVSKYLQKLIAQYVPSWGQQLITTLGDLDDILSVMRVLSTVVTTSTGSDTYVNQEQWDTVEFTYQGTKISSPPSAIPQIGTVKVPTYTSSEVCGTLFIDKHKISNVVGGIVKWAIDTALSIVTCTSTSTCYSSVDQALQAVIDCTKIGNQLDQMVQSIWSSAPSVASLVTSACNSQKSSLISKIKSELSSITTSLSLLSLSGVVKIPAPGSDTTLSSGKWYGVLGTSSVNGNFDGDFTAKKSP
jgi:hypothetical protein